MSNMDFVYNNIHIQGQVVADLDPIVFGALKRMRNHPPNTPYAGTPSTLTTLGVGPRFKCGCCRKEQGSAEYIGGILVEGIGNVLLCKTCYSIAKEKEVVKETLRPLGDKIVVRREEAAKASEGGILLPDRAQEKPTRGVVVAIGEGVKQDVLLFNYPAGNADAKKQQEINAEKIAGKKAMICPRNPNTEWPAVEQVQSPTSAVKVGDVVLFSSYAGNSVELDGQELLIMREEDVLCVVEKSK